MSDQMKIYDLNSIPWILFSKITIHLFLRSLLHHLRFRVRYQLFDYVAYYLIDKVTFTHFKSFLTEKHYINRYSQPLVASSRGYARGNNVIRKWWAGKKAADCFS